MFLGFIWYLILKSKRFLCFLQLEIVEIEIQRGVKVIFLGLYSLFTAVPGTVSPDLQTPTSISVVLSC